MIVLCLLYRCRAVTDPRDGRRVALKKLPNVFQSLVSSKRVFRELKMLCYFKHENVSIALISAEAKTTMMPCVGEGHHHHIVGLLAHVGVA